MFLIKFHLSTKNISWTLKGSCLPPAIILSLFRINMHQINMQSQWKIYLKQFSTKPVVATSKEHFIISFVFAADMPFVTLYYITHWRLNECLTNSKNVNKRGFPGKRLKLFIGHVCLGRGILIFRCSVPCYCEHTHIHANFRIIRNKTRRSFID